MKKLFFLILGLLCCAQPSYASSLDELYRDLIKSDNEGYLPMFVKNRHAPDVLLDDKLPDTAEIQPAPVADIPEPSEVNFINEERQKEDALKVEQRKWQETIKAVAENRVTPIELEEIIRRADQNNPKAVEIYAWMNTRGIGIKPDLPKAFQLYQKAILLGVPEAEKNAAQVYRALTPEQRANLGKIHL